MSKIALNVGYEYIIVDRDDVKDIYLVDTNNALILDEGNYSIFKGATHYDSTKIDELMNNNRSSCFRLCDNKDKEGYDSTAECEYKFGYIFVSKVKKGEVLYNAKTNNNDVVEIIAKDEEDAIKQYLELGEQDYDFVELYEMNEFGNTVKKIPNEKIVLRECDDKVVSDKLDSINGYNIIGVMDMNNGGDEAVVGYNPSNDKPYATWIRYKEAEGYVFIRGNYFNSLIEASKDQLDRCNLYNDEFAFDRYKEFNKHEKYLMYRFMSYFGVENNITIIEDPKMVEKIGDFSYQQWLKADGFRSVDDYALILSDGIVNKQYTLSDLNNMYRRDIESAIEMRDPSILGVSSNENDNDKGMEM